MKRIILLSDGTGNSSAKLSKTNVWRLYQSLDLQTDDNGVRQVACYSDGVGSSSFRPLAILGGVFGYGLKRNILHLYDFLCRHWEPNDEIWLFGFSRGAFTVRVLAGMIATQGILQGASGAELSYATRDVYRNYRKMRTSGKAKIPDPPLVPHVRKLRDACLRLYRKAKRQRAYPPVGLTDVHHIAFVGVWDTVAAYGSPIAEITLGIDRYIFLLSMPDRELNHKVAVARHALCLDDERDTFHPLLWNEGKTSGPERIKQVWFAGMHSDVGGGYPDDALSVQPLEWMTREARLHGLRFLYGAMDRFAPPPSMSALLHDSRHGLAGYYRYQPRRLSAYLLPQDRETELMVDPRLMVRAHVREILLHRSVVERLCDRASRYAPIVLPETFRIVERDGTITANPESAKQSAARMAAQAAVWDDVWRKRVVFRLTVSTSLLLAALPALGARAGDESCEPFWCAASPLFSALSTVLPSFLQSWTTAFAANPGTTLLLILILAVLLLRSSALERRLRDRMNSLLNPLRGISSRVLEPSPPGWVRQVRCSQWMLRWTKIMKWKVWPCVTGVGGLCLIAFAGVLAIALPVSRQLIAAAEHNGVLCGEDALRTAIVFGEFDTSDTCWNTGQYVEVGTSYRVTLRVTDPWLDWTIPSGPQGNAAADLRWLAGYTFSPWKRAIGGRWFQPHVSILQKDGPTLVQPLDFTDDGDVFVARLEPQQNGRVYMWVNDVVLPYLGLARYFYDNNHGRAAVAITPMSQAKIQRPSGQVGLTTPIRLAN